MAVMSPVEAADLPKTAIQLCLSMCGYLVWARQCGSNFANCSLQRWGIVSQLAYILVMRTTTVPPVRTVETPAAQWSLRWVYLFVATPSVISCSSSKGFLTHSWYLGVWYLTAQSCCSPSFITTQEAMATFMARRCGAHSFRLGTNHC